MHEAFAAGIVDNDELWLAMLNDRNSISHIYSETLAIEICNNIIGKYVLTFSNLTEQIKGRFID